MKRCLRNLPVVSLALVTINVIVFLVGFFIGDGMYYRGGLSRIPVVYDGEYDRIFWSMFLHNDTAHLFNNMIILLFIGSMLEREIGHVFFAFIYFASGIGGGIVSLANKIAMHSDVMSIGASGAVYGLDGLLLALVLCFAGFRRRMPLRKVLIVIALSLYDGFTRSNVDNSAHVGGLVVGFLGGLLVSLLIKIRNKK